MAAVTEETSPRAWIKWLAFVVPVALGIGVLVFAMRGRPPPPHALSERSTVVRVVSAPLMTVVPRAVGYGAVAPGREWKAVAQVSGRVKEVNPRLKQGEILPADDVLLRIDPADFHLAVAQIEANIRGAEAELGELDVQRENLDSSIAIVRRTLDLSRRDFKRKQALLKRGAISASQTDRALQDVLTGEQRVQDLANSLNLIPAKRKVLEAKLALYRTQLEDARLDLARTTIAAPFVLRLDAVNVERTQFVRQGDVLAEGSGIAVAEIAAQFPVDKVFPLVPSDLDPSAITPADLPELPRRLGFKAVVRLSTGSLTSEWRARFARMSPTVDPKTRTVGVVVAVDQPYRKARPGLRPALVKGMFVEVELRGRPRPQALIVPRTALHAAPGGDVLIYVADKDNRLRRRRVTVGLEQPGFVTVVDGLSSGERVVVSDPVPAIDGMLLDVVDDGAALARLRAQAAGKAAGG